jgi:Holliday junction resolvase RusA-like endonuclease
VRSLSFTVFGVAQPKGSTRAFVPKGWTRPIVTSDNVKNKGWQQLVAEAASQALHGAGVLFEGPLLLRVAFYLPRPKSLPKKVTAHIKKPDLDKLVRSCKDALTKVVWHDDAQVIRLDASKTYAAAGESPRAVITVIALTQGAAHGEEDGEEEVTREVHTASTTQGQAERTRAVAGNPSGRDRRAHHVSE